MNSILVAVGPVWQPQAWSSVMEIIYHACILFYYLLCIYLFKLVTKHLTVKKKKRFLRSAAFRRQSHAFSLNIIYTINKCYSATAVQNILNINIYLVDFEGKNTTESRCQHLLIYISHIFMQNRLHSFSTLH